MNRMDFLLVIVFLFTATASAIKTDPQEHASSSKARPVNPTPRLGVVVRLGGVKIEKPLQDEITKSPLKRVLVRITLNRFLDLLSREAAEPAAWETGLTAEEQDQWMALLRDDSHFASVIQTRDERTTIDFKDYWHKIQIDPKYQAIALRLSNELSARAEAAKAAADVKAEEKSPASVVAE